MLLEHEGKHLLAKAGLPIPHALLAHNPSEAANAASEIGGEVIVKAQLPLGGRGRLGAIQRAANPAEAKERAQDLLGMRFGAHTVTAVLVEETIDIYREVYVAVTNDAASKGPMVLFSADGGVDIEEVEINSPEKIHRQSVDIRRGISAAVARQLIGQSFRSTEIQEKLASFVIDLYSLYRRLDAELVEINPVAITTGCDLLALDCKISLDRAGVVRHPELTYLQEGADNKGTVLERRAAEEGLLFLELDGDIGILANGAGLTMATLDSVSFHGGRPANFLEIGGDAYTRGRPALQVVLAHPNVKSMLVNFCGAFARTDTMIEGVVAAVEELKPDLPMSFSVHGTGEEKAAALLRERLGIDPHYYMDDAIREAVEAAKGAVAR